jgi:hypothetical protein
MPLVKKPDHSITTKCTCHETNGSWLEHWKINNRYGLFKYLNPELHCTAFGCINMAAHGAHVQKINPDDSTLYIIPLCNTCNQKPNGEAFEISSYDDLVPAVCK